MKTLFRIEFTKSINYNPFRIILILHFLFFLLGLFALPRINIKIPFLSIIPLYQFPHVWNFTTWIAGYYNITLVLLVIMMTTLEFSNMTYKQQAIFGMSRRELFMEKLVLIFFLSLYVVVLLVFDIHRFRPDIQLQDHIWNHLRTFMACIELVPANLYFPVPRNSFCNAIQKHDPVCSDFWVLPGLLRTYYPVAGPSGIPLVFPDKIHYQSYTPARHH